MKNIAFVGLILLLLSGAASAQGIGGGPGGPPPGGGGGGLSSSVSTADGGGSRGHWSMGSWLTLGGNLYGNAILASGRAKPVHYLLWNGGYAIGALAGAGPAVVLGAGALALFEPDHGLFPRLFRPGGLRCQEVDRGYVDGCAWWLDHHALASARRHTHRGHRQRRG